VFELAVLRELPYASVAQTLGIPIGTVKSRVFHALRKLREFLETRDA
jgi:DNA-directed RNA polymerase specialized sigma24 family protein